MRKILNEKFYMLIFILCFSMFPIVNVNAETTLENVNISTMEIRESLMEMSPTGENTIIPDNNQGSGSLQKAENYMNRKLGDVVKFLQSFIKPFTYITFILSAISIIIGMISGSKHKFAGILGMAFSILVYMCVSFGPEIVEYFATWLTM